MIIYISENFILKFCYSAYCKLSFLSKNLSSVTGSLYTLKLFFKTLTKTQYASFKHFFINLEGGQTSNASKKNYDLFLVSNR